jgi:O-antigen/teichoic acid export membrane protein
MGVVIRQSIKASISNYFGMVLGFGSLFLLFPLFFEPDELGAIRLLLETGAVISSFALLGTNYSINRFFPYFRSEEKRHNGFFFLAFGAPFTGFLIMFLGLVLLRSELLGLFSRDAERLNGLYPYLILLVFFVLYQQVSESSLANHGRIAVPNFFREVVVRAVQIVAGYCFFMDWIGFEATIASIVLGYGAAVAGNMFYLNKLTNVSFRPDFGFLKQNPALKNDMLRFTGFLFAGGLTGLIVNKLDFLMLSSMKSLSDTAIYSIGFYLAMTIDIPKRTLLQISAPIMSGHMKENRLSEASELYKKTTLNQVLAGTILFYLIWINIDNFYSIMPRGDFYASGKWVVFILGIGRLLDALGSAAGTVLVNSKYYHWAFVNFLVSSVVAIIGNYLLIPRFGLTGAALATLLTIAVNQIAIVAIVYIKTGLHPFEKSKIRLLILFLMMLIPSFLGAWLKNPFLDGLAKTLLLGGLFMFLCFQLHISKDMNALLSTQWQKLQLKFRNRA